MLQAARDVLFIFQHGEAGVGANAETFQLLAHDGFEQRAGAVAVNRVAIEHSD